MNVLDKSIPQEVRNLTQALKKAKFEAYLVGGCVRDLLIEKTPKDWDITTNASPEDILKLFPDSFYENNFGTVGVKNEDVSDETLKIVEITPYRTEGTYTDHRRPDTITFGQSLEEDLKRRDFTINALAYDVEEMSLTDLFKGQEDIKDKILRTVGDAHNRFSEDALRMLRAIRLHAELGFSIAPDVEKAITTHAPLLKNISKERIRDEFTRIILSTNPQEALVLSYKTNLLTHIIPELEEGIGIEQGGIHAFDVWTHLLKALQHTADKGWELDLRIAALLHDIAKPQTRRPGGKKMWTFYGHEVVGARMAEKIMKRLVFSKELTEKVRKLVRWHMFFTDTEQITHSAVRRLVAKVGKENVWDLMKLRMADRIGTGRPKEDPYRLRMYKSLVEEVMSDPVSVGMLKIDGTVLMERVHVKPGPLIGHILHALLDEVIDTPSKNTEEYLIFRAQELQVLPFEEVQALGEKGRNVKDEVEKEKVAEIRKKHWVK